MIPKSYIVCTETAEDFQKEFDGAIQKIFALGSIPRPNTYEFREGKFVVFIEYQIVVGQKDFAMSLPLETLRDLESTRQAAERQRCMAAIEEISASRKLRGEHKKNTRGGKTNRITPSKPLVGLHTPTGIGRRWERFITLFKGWNVEHSS